MKVVGPYIKGHEIYDGWVRPRLINNGFHSIWAEDVGRWKVATIHYRTFASKEDAMIALDELLIKEGWIILDQEKFDALKILL